MVKVKIPQAYIKCVTTHKNVIKILHFPYGPKRTLNTI